MLNKLQQFIYEACASFAATMLLLLMCSPAHAATFNLFSPATGILKGTATSYLTTSASASDIVAMFSGTCNSTTALRGDGSCGTLSTGSVTSVSLTAPSVFSVSGSPVTTSGTLALAFATGQTQNRVLASPNGSSGAIALRALVAADIPTISLTSGVSGTLPAGNGGLGITTTTDDTVPVGSGSAWVSTALPSCDDTGGNHLNYSISTNTFSCGTSGGASGANPSASAGLTAVNGSASTFMRSDGAPAISQSISPTWTGRHIFNYSGYPTEGIEGASFGRRSGYPVLYLDYPAAAADNRLIEILSTGTTFILGTSNDAGTAQTSAITFTRSGSTISSIQFGNAPVGFNGANYGSSGQVLTSQGSSSPPIWTAVAATTSGTGTLILSGGCASGNSANYSYRLSGNFVTLWITQGGGLTCTSTSTSLVVTGLAGGITPATAHTVAIPGVMDNGNLKPGYAYVDTSGAITLAVWNGTAIATSGFTSSGSKGVPYQWSVTYPID